MMSTLASAGVNGALGSYQIRRLFWNMPWYEMNRGNYFVDLARDIAILVLEIIWNIVSPFIYMLVSLVIYMAIYLAMIFLFFYLLFCLF